MAAFYGPLPKTVKRYTADVVGDIQINDALRRIPGVDSVLDRPSVKELLGVHPRWAVVEAIRQTLESARIAVRADPSGPAAELSGLDAEVAQASVELLRPSLVPVINATGVVLHTNLGRAPLAGVAMAAIEAASRGWSNLEYDLSSGTRGNRHGHLAGLFRDLTGAEATVVVNNNASALLLSLSALAEGGEVVVSRGELIEIGGSFRIPDVCRQGGVSLVEVGTTNRTHPADYRDAIGPETRALLKVHLSNFAMKGFVADVAPAALCEIASDAALPVIWDLGSGCLVDLADIGLGNEPTVRQAVESGADLVTFSGDKLLGGPQAGIICGRASVIDRLRKHPLMRALRPSKGCIAALEATLRLYRDADPFQEIPVLRMLSARQDELVVRATALAARIAETAPKLAPRVVETTGRVGGGALPEALLPSAAVRLDPSHCGGASALAQLLHRGRIPVVARVEEGGVHLDLRTVSDRDIGPLAEACATAARITQDTRAGAP